MSCLYGLAPILCGAVDAICRRTHNNYYCYYSTCGNIGVSAREHNSNCAREGRDINGWGADGRGIVWEGVRVWSIADWARESGASQMSVCRRRI
jgi:hypothetical protein